MMRVQHHNREDEVLESNTNSSNVASMKHQVHYLLKTFVTRRSLLCSCKTERFHNLDMLGLKNVILWNRLRKWLNEAKGLCSPEHLKEFSLGNLEKEISLLKKELPTESQEIGFCHNDMQFCSEF
ncbi:hypothetical protein RND71_028173 [Anisodus tanguticus]|uniref:Uncharacterized protein n=1 Tax=Anisodus tanguticus TaxID=243964 RepID=A0AAE1RHZ9_9SOLA|nr:hypothetical protein RND71_028173 [Anisodus tanguticus]